MSEPRTVELFIGGKLSRTLAPEFCTVINNDGLKLEWGEEAQVKSKELLKYGGEGKPLELKSHDCHYGMTDTVSLFCQKHNLAYSKRISAYDDDPETLEYLLPGMTSPIVWFGAVGGIPTISVHELSRWRKSGKSLEDVIEFLKTLTPKIPPFRWTK